VPYRCLYTALFQLLLSIVTHSQSFLMAPRRPSSATDADSRLPFASAEALLWGPEMKQQHAHLLTEMRALQKHHEAYDSRIRNTEHVAKSAEAATSRVRHLEQQLAAIEAEDDDKAFEKWAAGEMTRLGIFIDTNKHVRQKQIELDNIVSHAVEDIDKLRSVPRELKVVLRRLDLLEAGHNHDAQKIKSLQEEVARLKSIRQGSAPNTAGLSTISRPQHGILRPMTPSKLLNAEILDVTSETDDEDLMLLRTFPHEEIQVPQSPETRAK
jgi:vacuolar-type H+-ATPase subunit I/STV1